MTDLNELQKKIYAKTPTVSSRPDGKLSNETLPSSSIGWKKSEPSFFFRHIWLLSISVIILFGGALFLLFGSGGFSEDKVEVIVQTSKEVSGIEVVEWKVAVSNKNSLNLEDMTLTFEYPEYALPVEDDSLSGRTTKRTLGTLEAGRDIERAFKARLFGQEDEVKKVRVLISYKSPGISRSFEKEVFSEVSIASSPLALALEGQDQLQSGVQVGWNIKINNLSDYDFSNLRLRLEYPKGFTYIGASPEPQFQQTIWEIPSLKIGQEKTIELQGKLEGAINETKELQAYVEYPVEGTNYVVLTKKIATSNITMEPFTLSFSANGSAKFVAHTSDTVEVEVAYKNNTQEPVNDVVLEAQFVSDAIDPTSMQTNGIFDPVAMTVRWDYTNTPEFKEVLPSQDGTVSAILMVKSKLPIKQPSHKNFQIRIVGTLTSKSPSSSLPAQKVYRREEFVIPIGTNLALQIEGDKSALRFPNNNSIPPAVDRQTTYTVVWRVMNSSNDVQDVSIVATLPEYVTFTGLKQANFDADNLYVDQDKRQMVWTIKKLPATTGIALPVYEGAFQLGVTPGNQHVGKIIDILGSVQVKGVDTFTGDIISLPLYPPLTTDLGGTLKKGQATVVAQ